MPARSTVQMDGRPVLSRSEGPRRFSRFRKFPETEIAPISFVYVLICSINDFVVNIGNILQIKNIIARFSQVFYDYVKNNIGSGMRLAMFDVANVLIGSEATERSVVPYQTP